MSRDCLNIANNIIDIIENNIPETRKKAIQEHLALCPRCNRVVNRFTRAWKELCSGEKFEPSERFWPELLTKIEAFEKPLPHQEKIISGLRKSLRPVVVSLVLLFGIYFGYQLGNWPNTEITLSELSYIEQYVQDFQDIPEGSVSDFFTKYEIPIQEEKP